MTIPADHRKFDGSLICTRVNILMESFVIRTLLFSASWLLCSCAGMSGGIAGIRTDSVDFPIAIPEDATLLSWVREFRSTRLTALVTEAVTSNRDLPVIAARVARFQALADESRSLGVPRVDFETGMGATENRGNSPDGSTYNARFALSWEIDLWGRLLDTKKSSRLEAKAREADLAAAKLSLSGAVVKSAIDGYEAREQIRLSQKNLAVRRNTLAILDSRWEAGVADEKTALDISLTRSDIAGAEARLEGQRLMEEEATRDLEVLLGRHPSGGSLGVNDFPDSLKSIPGGLPADLLMRRPDLLAWEIRLAAAGYRVSASRKTLLPSLGLTGSSGMSVSDVFSRMLDLNELASGIAASLLQPVFEGGRLRAGIRVSEAEHQEIISAYSAAVLVAFREVYSALSTDIHLARQELLLQKSSTEANRASDLALSQYEKGLVDIITVLESQRRSYDRESDYLTVRISRLKNRADLHMALGGDFTRLWPSPARPAL
jgi:outer membrane protein, multidrug efflux system